MLVKPTVLELLTKVDNRFELVTMTAKRARQIAKGNTPLTKKEEPSPVSLAADEIAEGKVVNKDKVQEELEEQEETEEVVEN